MFAPWLKDNGRPFTRPVIIECWGAHNGGMTWLADGQVCKGLQYASNGQWISVILKIQDFERYSQKIKARISFVLFFAYEAMRLVNLG